MRNCNKMKQQNTVQKRHQSQGQNKGFTLVELIIVVAIIAVLAAVLAPQYLKYVERSRQANDAQIAASIMDAAEVAINDPKNRAPAGETYRVIWFTNTTPLAYGWGGSFDNTGSTRSTLGAIAVGPGEGSSQHNFWLSDGSGWSTQFVQEDVTRVMGLWNTQRSDAGVVAAESAIGTGQNLIFDIHTSTGEITIHNDSSDWAELLGMN